MYIYINIYVYIHPVSSPEGLDRIRISALKKL